MVHQKGGDIPSQVPAVNESEVQKQSPSDTTQDSKATDVESPSSSPSATTTTASTTQNNLNVKTISVTSDKQLVSLMRSKYMKLLLLFPRENLA